MELGLQMGLPFVAITMANDIETIVEKMILSCERQYCVLAVVMISTASISRGSPTQFSEFFTCWTLSTPIGARKKKQIGSSGPLQDESDEISAEEYLGLL